MKFQPIETKVIQKTDEIDDLLSRELELTELAESWLSSGRDYSIDIINGLDDNDEFASVGLLLKKGEDGAKEAFAEVYYDISVAKEKFSDLSLIEQFVIQKANYHKYEPSFDLDKDSCEKQEIDMGFTMDKDLCYPVNSFDKIVQYMLMYGMSEGGGASIHYPPNYFFEDMILEDDDELPEDYENILLCESWIGDVKSGYSIGSYRFFRGAV